MDNADDVKVRWMTRSGHRIRITETGSGQPLLFLHGCGFDAVSELRSLLPMPNVHLALPDQRGHGGSTPVRTKSGFELSELVSDASACLTAMGWAPGDAVVGGGSMGAAVALALAISQPEACKGLVLVGPALGPTAHPMSATFRDVGERILSQGLAETIAELEASMVAGGMTAEAAQHGLDPLRRQDPHSLATAMQTIFDWRPLRSWDGLGVIDVPVLLLGFEDDPAHPMAMAEQMHRHLRASTLVRLTPDPTDGSPHVGGFISSWLAENGLV